MYMRFLIPEGQKVLELGCGTGHLLAGLKPSYGLGIDLSPRTIEVAKQNYPKLEFINGDIETSTLIEGIESTFDAIVLSGTIGTLEECQETLRSLPALCDHKTRIVISFEAGKTAAVCERQRDRALP